MAWTTLSFPFGSILTSSKMTQMYDNFAALANGDSGAPSIQAAAIATDAVTSAKIADYPWGSEDIRSDTITAGNIAASAVGNSELASNAVTNVKVTNGTLGTEKFQTGTTERDWVLARTASASVGVVGSYAFLVTTVNNDYNAGTTVSASFLRYSDTLPQDGAQPSGTWRVMGSVENQTASVWLRIS